MGELSYLGFGHIVDWVQIFLPFKIPLFINCRTNLHGPLDHCSRIMIPAEVENLQSQLVGGQLAVEEFFAIIMQSYDLDLCKESFTIHVSSSQNCIDISISLPSIFEHEFEDLYHRCT